MEDYNLLQGDIPKSDVQLFHNWSGQVVILYSGGGIGRRKGVGTNTLPDALTMYLVHRAGSSPALSTMRIT